MLLSPQEIRNLSDIPAGWPRIPLVSPFCEDSLGPCSYDLLLGGRGLIERPDGKTVEIPLGSHVLEPGEFMIGSTNERFSIPWNLCAFVHPRFTDSRDGLEITSMGMLHPGFKGFAALRIRNISKYSSIIIAGYTAIAQVCFAQLDQQSDKPYRGRFQGSLSVEFAGST